MKSPISENHIKNKSEYLRSNSEKQNDYSPLKQLIDNRPSTAIQRKISKLANNQFSKPNKKKPNNTGLPDNLKSGIERLSGYSLDDVNVHYNSNKPADLNAHAYAQGTQIHLGPGQEKHLPHEAWHVVQQKQGRVKPTMQLKGRININDDIGLEKEADVMGAKALKQSKVNNPEAYYSKTNFLLNSLVKSDLTQRVTKIRHKYEQRTFPELNEQYPTLHTVGINMEARLDPDDPVTGSAVPSTNYAWMEALNYRTENLMIRGHLLNHDLGGFGVPENLYPISNGANMQHSRLVENPVKTLLKKAMDTNPNFYQSKPRVQYSVDVIGNSLDVYFDCKWKMEDHPLADTEDKKQRHVKIGSHSKMKWSPAIGDQNEIDNPSFSDGSEIDAFKKTEWGHNNRKGRIGYSLEKEGAEGQGENWQNYRGRNKINLFGGKIEDIEWGTSNPKAEAQGKTWITELLYRILAWHKYAYHNTNEPDSIRKRAISTAMEEVFDDEYEGEFSYGSKTMYRLIGIKGKTILNDLENSIKNKINQLVQEQRAPGLMDTSDD